MITLNVVVHNLAIIEALTLGEKNPTFRGKLLRLHTYFLNKIIRFECCQDKKLKFEDVAIRLVVMC